MDKKQSKPTLLLDFDNTTAFYKNGWQGESTINELPTVGVTLAIQELREKYLVVIFSSRAATPEGKAAIAEWLKKWQIKVDGVTHEKIPASIIVDDRAITFKGDWQQTLDDVREFSPHGQLRDKKNEQR